MEAVVRRLADARLITTEGDAKAAGDGLGRGGPRGPDPRLGPSSASGSTPTAPACGSSASSPRPRESGTPTAGRAVSSYGGSRLAVARSGRRLIATSCNELEAEFLAASLRRRRRAKACPDCVGRRVGGLGRSRAGSGPGGKTGSRPSRPGGPGRSNSSVEGDRYGRGAGPAAVVDAGPRRSRCSRGPRIGLNPAPRTTRLRRRVAGALEAYQKKEAEREDLERDPADQKSIAVR